MNEDEFQVDDYLNETARDVAILFDISLEIAEIVLKVFVPEDQRIALDEFYNRVMKTKRLRTLSY